MTKLPESDRRALEELGFLPIRQTRPRIHCVKCSRLRQNGEDWTVICTECHGN